MQRHLLAGLRCLSGWEKSLHINMLELHMVNLALETFLHAILGSKYQVLLDTSIVH